MAVRLRTDRDVYAPGSAMSVELENATGRPIDVISDLASLRLFRVANGRREPQRLSLREHPVARSVTPGEEFSLPPVPAPAEAGRYELEVRYFVRAEDGGRVARTKRKVLRVR